MVVSHVYKKTAEISSLKNFKGLFHALITLSKSFYQDFPAEI